MRQQDNIIQRNELGVYSWLILVYLKPRTGDRPLHEQLGECPLIHDLAATSIDQIGALLQKLQPMARQQVECRRRARTVDGNNIHAR